MAMRIGDYRCTVVRRDIAFRVDTPHGAHTLFVSCTGHPTCGTFAKGLPQTIEDLPPGLTGCPLVDTHAIMR